MANIIELDIREEPGFPIPSLEEVRRFFPFQELREFQGRTLRTLAGAFNAGYRTVILEAPTGFGKSPIAVAISRHFKSLKKSSYIIVSSKYLQDQYVADFETVTVKGRGNFRCIRKKHTCELAQQMARQFRCRHIPAPGKEDEKRVLVGKSAKRGELYQKKGIQICPYWKQKCAAMGHSFPILNYDYFLHETQFVGDLGKRDLVICDEAHNIESKLMRFIGFEISSNDLEAVGASVPDAELKMETWKSLLGEWRDLFMKKVEKMESKMESLTALELDKLEEYRSKSSKCDFLMGELDIDPELWVVSMQPYSFKGRSFKKIIFKPIAVKKWGEHIFSKGEHFLLQSATIINAQTLCESLNIRGDVLYLKIPSTFPAQNRLFHCQGVGGMSRRNKEKTMPLLLKGVERIISANPQEKGVIHTHTYAIMRKIAESIKNPRIVFNDSSASRDDVFEQFKQSARPLILVTPSAFEGVDFKDDACRWQVLCKVPYPNLGDPQVRKRTEKDRQWYTWLTALKIVQLYGRGMRTPEDFCTTYILDSDFERFYSQNKKFFPEWFQAAIRWKTRQ